MNGKSMDKPAIINDEVDFGEIINKEIQIVSTATIGDILDSIEDSLSVDDVVNFVIALDLNTADWNVTNKLYKYFKEERIKYIRDIQDEFKDQDSIVDWQ